MKMRVTGNAVLSPALVMLALSLLVSPLAASEMSVGVAKSLITNDTPRVMVNGRVSEGTLEDLYARVLVLNDGSQRLIIVTYDLNCLDVGTAVLRKRVRDELGIDPAQLILLATHNHNAPIQINPDNFDYGKWLADTILDAIQKAMAAERGPAQVFLGSGYGYFVTNVGNVPIDYEIQVLKVTQGGHPVALLFNHGMHPMQASMKKVGAGHPGYAMAEIEAALPRVQAMYAVSGAGNQFPAGFQKYLAMASGAGGKSPEEIAAFFVKECKAFGHELAEVVLGVDDDDFQEVTGPVSAKMEVLSLPLAPPIPREEAMKLAEDFPKDVGFVHYPHDHRGTNWVRMLLHYYEKGLPFPTSTTDMVCTDDTYLIHKSDKEFLERYASVIDGDFPCVYEEVIVAQIGPMPLVAMQGEICAPICARIKDTFRRDRPIMTFGYMGEHNLYIPTRELVRLQTYQAKVIQIQYASPVGWAPEVEDEMVKGVVRMVKSMVD